MQWCACLLTLCGTAFACAPSGPQATTYDCPAKRNTARAFLSPQLRSVALPPPLAYAPATECGKGQCGDNKVFYNEVGADTEAAAVTFKSACPDLCACADDGTCYTWDPAVDDSVGIGLLTYCDGSSFSGCAVYAIPTNVRAPADGIIATDGSGKAITADDVFDFTTGRPYDIRTNPERFTQIVSATCDGCAGECAQKHPTDY